MFGACKLEKNYFMIFFLTIWKRFQHHKELTVKARTIDFRNTM